MPTGPQGPHPAPSAAWGQPDLQVPNMPANPDSLRIPIPGGDPSCVGPQYPGPHALSALGAPPLPCPVTRPPQACPGRWPPTRSLDVLELWGERSPPLPDNMGRQSLLCSPSSSLRQAACGKRPGLTSGWTVQPRHEALHTQHRARGIESHCLARCPGHFMADPVVRGQQPPGTDFSARGLDDRPLSLV